MSAIPGAGDAIGLAAKGITGCTKASKAIKYATRLAGKAGNCALSAYSTSKQIWGMWDKYVFKGESWGNESWGELLGVTVSSVSTASSAKGIVADLRNYSYVKHDILTSQCFVEGTLIVTDEGDKPIEEIKAGDFVYSTNPETGESEYKEVLRTFRKESDVLIHIFVNGEEIETTPVHPFWVVDQWVSAKDLETGDILTLADGTTAPVTDTYGEQLDEPVIVYNFEVSDFHTYYVADTGVLVHNANCNVKSSNPNSYYTYSELKDEIYKSSLNGAFEAHHLLEKQYANRFGISNANEIISVPLTSRWHRGVDAQTIGQGVNIDSKINKELKSITGSATVKAAKCTASAEQIWQAHRNVYTKMGQGDWANAIYEAYVKKLGISY